jgi:hypothetical protein
MPFRARRNKSQHSRAFTNTNGLNATTVIEFHVSIALCAGLNAVDGKSPAYRGSRRLISGSLVRDLPFHDNVKRAGRGRNSPQDGSRNTSSTLHSQAEYNLSSSSFPSAQCQFVESLEFR